MGNLACTLKTYCTQKKKKRRKDFVLRWLVKFRGEKKSKLARDAVSKDGMCTPRQEEKRKTKKKMHGRSYRKYDGSVVRKKDAYNRTSWRQKIRLATPKQDKLKEEDEEKEEDSPA